MVTCVEEVGSGTLGASGGRFFSTLEPIPGYTSGNVEMHDPLQGLEFVETVAINAREKTGDVVDADSRIKETLERVAAENAVPIVHSVFGSKTGICQDLRAQMAYAKEKVEKLGGFFVVDACQGRMPDRMVRDLLDDGVIVLITGSKFFRGPPFSGGVMVPPQTMKRLLEVQAANAIAEPVPKGLNTFMGKAEIPRELPSWRDCVADNQNPGLALRWEAALAEMEPTMAIEES